MSNGKGKKNGNGTKSKDDPCPWLEDYRFKPGQSGNPGGRPRSTPVTNEISKWLLKKHKPADYGLEKILGKKEIPGARIYAVQMMVLAMAGNGTAMRESLERVEGRVPEEFQGSLYHQNIGGDSDTSQAVAKLTPAQKRDLGAIIMRETRKNGNSNGTKAKT